MDADLDLVRSQIDLLPRDKLSRLLESCIPRLVELLASRRYSPSLIKFLARTCSLEGEPLKNVVFELSSHFLSILQQAFNSQRHCDDVVKDGMMVYDNATTSLHALVDLQKNYRGPLEGMVPAFLDLVIFVFTGLVDYLQTFFDSLNVNATTSSSNRRTSRSINSEKIALGIKRLKLIAELPVVVVLVFQLHRRYINDYIPKYVPLVIKSLSFHMSPAQSSVEQDIRQFYSEFISLKVKLVSFFAYVSRGFFNSIRVYAAEIPTVVISMLRDCPPEAAMARKELLVAIRHILNTDLRANFIPFIDILFDENLLRGEGYTSMVVHRPVALSLLADLVHNVRSDLQPPHLVHVLSIFSRSLQDTTLPMTVQLMSAKLLISVLECVANESLELTFRKALISKILGSLILKVSALRKLLMYNYSPHTSTGLKSADDRVINPFYEELKKSPLIEEEPKDMVRDAKFLLRALISGVKGALLAMRTVAVGMGDTNLAMQITASAQTTPTSRATGGSGGGAIPPTIQGCGLSLDDGRILGSFFEDSLYCFDLYLLNETGSQAARDSLSSTVPPSASAKMGSNMPPGFVAAATSAIPPDEKDLIDQFSYIFTIIEPFIFQDVIGSRLPLLLERTRSNPHLLLIPQFFLALSGISKSFVGCLLAHLMDKLPVIADTKDPVSSFIHMRLFKLIFLSLTIYPDDIEPLLQPYISKLIIQCLKSRPLLFRSAPTVTSSIQASSSSPQSSNPSVNPGPTSNGPINYFLLLRSLFRNIAGGKYELLFKEVHSMLQPMLEDFNRIIDDPHSSNQNLKDVCVELCLTVPVRLSNLLPYLSLLMHPLIQALKTEGDLVSQGLRTLELCIDNLTQEFLEPIFSSVIDELVGALSGLLNSPLGSGSQMSGTIYSAMKILGKFGGRSRRIASQGAYSVDIAECSDLEKKAFSLTITDISDPSYLSLSDNLQLPLDSTLETLLGILPPHFPSSSSQKHMNLVPVVKSLLHSFVLNVKIRGGKKSPKSNEFVIGSHELKVFKRLLSFMIRDATTQDPFIIETLVPAILNSPLKHRLISTLTEVSLESFSLEPQATSCFGRAIWENLNSSFNNEAFALEFQKFTAEVIIALCYDTVTQPLDKKAGPARVFEFLLTNPKLVSVNSVCLIFGMRLFRALLFILKDPFMSDIGPGDVAPISSSIYRLLRCLMNAAGAPNAPNEFDSIMAQVITLMVTELSSTSSAVRTAIKSSFQLISELRGIEVVELLSPYCERLLFPIFAKPLRALPFTTQIGYIDAINYCMSLKPPLLSLESEETIRFLQEVLALADADDSSLLKSNSIKAGVVIESLRIVCLQLLSTVLPVVDGVSSPPISPIPQSPPLPHHSGGNGNTGSTSKFSNLRNLIVSVFFKSLYSRSAEVVSVAQKGLEAVLSQQNKLPKDLLQHGLRPVLMNLADAKRLTLPGLEGLCRVLQLLTTYFKPEIGRKLLDHFSVWAEPRILNELPNRALSDNQDLKILTSIINVFHLLPSSAGVFVPEIIKKVLEVEGIIKRSAASPFRDPLLLYLALYPEEASAFFFENVHLFSVSGLFTDLIQRNGSEPLAREIAMKIESFIPLIISPPGPSSAARSEYLRFMGALITKHHSLFSQGAEGDVKGLRDLIGGLWTSFEEVQRRKQIGESFFYAANEEDYQNLLTISQKYIVLKPSDIEFCYSWLLMLKPSLPLDLTWMPRFISQEWLPLCNLSDLQKSFKSWILMIGNNDLAPMSKSNMSKLFGIPLASLIKVLNKASQETVFERSCERHMNEIILLKDSKGLSPTVIVTELQVLSIIWELFNAEMFSGYLNSRLMTTDILAKAAVQAAISISKRASPIMLETAITQSHSDSKNLIRVAIENSFSSQLNFQQWTSTLCRILGSDSPTLSSVCLVWTCFLSCMKSFVGSSNELILSLLSSVSRFGVSASAVPEYREIGFSLMERLSLATSNEPLWNILINCIIRCLAPIMDNSNESINCRLLASNCVKNIKNCAMNNGLIAGVDLSGLDKVVHTQFSSGSSGVGSDSLIDDSIANFLINFFGCFSADVLSTCPRCLGMVFYNANPNSLNLLRSCFANSTCVGLVNALIGSVITSSLSATGPETSSATHSSLLFPQSSPHTPSVPVSNSNTRQITLALNLITIPVNESDSPPLLMLVRLVQKILGRESVSPELEAIICLVLEKLNGKFELFGENPKSVLLGALQAIWSSTKNMAVFNSLINFISSHHPPPFPLVSIILTPSSLSMVNFSQIPPSYFKLILDLYKSGATEENQLAKRLEGSFLTGLVIAPLALQLQFLEFLSSHLPTGLYGRLAYGFGGISWGLVSGKFWLPHLMAFIFDPLVKSAENSLFKSLIDAMLKSSSESELKLCISLWRDWFPALWSKLSSSQQADLSLEIAALLSQEENHKQPYNRPHPLAMIVESFLYCCPPPTLSPYIIGKCGQWFGCWFASIQLLEIVKSTTPLSSPVSQEIASVLGDLYRRIGFQSLYYGLARRNAQLNETVVALSLGHDCRITEEQAVLESVQQKALNGQLPYVDPEFTVWEREWSDCAKRLQQWDLVGEIARTDDDPLLQLESLWRTGDWNSQETFQSAHSLLKTLSRSTSRSNAPGLSSDAFRLKIFEGILLLNQVNDLADRANHFQTYIEEAWAMALQEWKHLPDLVSVSHLPVLELFQSLVELQEAFTIFSSLAVPGSLHRQAVMTELKGLLGTWRDRLPNRWEDIGTWGNLVTWRQYVYSQLNNSFQPLLAEMASMQPPQMAATATSEDFASQQASQASQQPGQQQQSSATSVHPLAFRGYHEMAWIINRFSNASRKAGLLDLCIASLNKIYTLPNIEIQDAFLKLREQTKCYLTSPGELPLALDVVNATNLNYFNGSQKGDFFALKALILSRLGMIDEANRVFAQSVQIDLNSSKGWSEWAKFNDNRFQQASLLGAGDINFAVNAINCYLQAAALHKAHRARRYLARVLWLLSFEDESGSLGKTFEMYSSELPVWNWVMFIPQLLTSLGRKECKFSRFILVKIGKCFPQSLYLPLRVFNEELKMNLGYSPPAQTIKSPRNSTTEPPLPPNQPHLPHLETEDLKGTVKQSNSPAVEDGRPRKTSLEETDDLLAILKTGYPLLALSMENMVDHIVNRLRASPDEDLLRILRTLLMETYQQSCSFISQNQQNIGTDVTSLSNLEAGLKKVSDMMTNYAYLSSKYKSEFDADFIHRSGTTSSAPGGDIWNIMANLKKWNEKLESNLPQAKGEHFPLDSVSRYLSEFEYQRYDELEMPGQSMLGRDNPAENIKLVRWSERVDIIRRHGTSYRKAYCLGSDGKTHSFIIQNPVARHGRKEERLLQFLRLVRGTLSRKIRSRRCNLHLHVPLVVSLSSHARMIQEDCSADTLEDIMMENGFDPDELVGGFISNLRGKLSPPLASSSINPTDSSIGGNVQSTANRQGAELLNARVKLVETVLTETNIDSILVNYWVNKCLKIDPSYYFLMRHQFSQNYACQLFISYMMAIGNRSPHKIIIQPKNGAVLNYEQLPSSNNAGQIALMEAVPFRLGPSFQKFIGVIGLEGIVAETIFSIAQCFNTGEEGDMGTYLPLYLRDELVSWILHSSTGQLVPGSASSSPLQFPQAADIFERENALFEKFSYVNINAASQADSASSASELMVKIKQNVELVTKRVQTLAGAKAMERIPDITVPVNQNVLDLLACATNIQKIALMDPSWQPWI